MADISKINAVALANIAKLDAVLAANIAKVNGLVFSTAPAIPAPVAAYSVRLLDTAVGVPTYTGAAMRVRRDTGGTGDDDEADIAFDSGIVSLDSAISNASAGVTATTLGQFINVDTVNGTTYTNPDSLTVTASCYVDTWYDQSGNANDAEQTAQGSQPQIHDGTVNTDLIQEDGKPKLKAITQFFDTGISLSGTSWHFTAAKNDASKFVHYSNSGLTPFWAFGSPGSDPAHNGVTPTYYHNGVLMTSTTRANIRGAFGSQALVSTTHSTAIASLRLGHSSSFPFASAHEFIIYNSDQSSNRSAIEGNINAHFQIGNFGTPTSGLLATYTGAAAAYSVRQLANTAALSMRVREDATDTETDIGFDANGDLDTAAIAAHCGTANGYVVTWYDQSGNGNDAEQPTAGGAALQPKIYDGTSQAVITENGKPAVDYSTGQELIANSLSTGSEDRSIYSVYRSDAATNDNHIFDLTDTTSGATGSRYSISTEVGLRCYATIYVPNGGTTSQTLLSLEQDVSENPEIHIYTNGTEQGTGGNISESVTSGSTVIGSSSQRSYNGTLQEILVYISDQSDNRSGIETDINTYFSIY